MRRILDRLAVEKSIRKLNKHLKKDIYGKRFYAKITKSQFQNGVGYYLFTLYDREQPERNEESDSWYNVFEICKWHCVWREMNEFIVRSNFWENYKK